MTEFYEKLFEIKIRHCDKFGKLKVPELFKFMQECAVTHAEMIGAGMKEMRKSNRTFVLSRVKIKVAAMPGYGESVLLKTYPAGTDCLFYIRDFEITCKNRYMAEARTLWVLIDIDSRRPVRDREMGKSFSGYKDAKVELDSPVKLGVLTDGRELFSVDIGYSKIDVLGHVNNSHYIEWTCDCMGSEFFKEDDEYSINVNFLSEISEGDSIIIYGENMCFAGKNQKGRNTFAAKVER